MSKKSAFYQELVVMLEKPGCPVCHVGQKVSRSYLENLLWGSVNDREVRGTLDQSMGFCGQHSRDLLNFTGERLGTAIIQQALLKEGLRRLERSGARPRRSLLKRLQATLPVGDQPEPEESPLGQQGTCPVCAQSRKMEQRSLEELVQHLVSDLDGRLLAAGGLCWQHLERALAITEDPSAHRSLVELHQQVWQQIIAHLGEFIRKRDYRFSQETISDEEGSSLLRAIAILTGEYPPPSVSRL